MSPPPTNTQATGAILFWGSRDLCEPDRPPVIGSFVEDLLTRALPPQPGQVLCVARDPSALAGLVASLLEGQGDVGALELKGSSDTFDGVEEGTVGVVVLGDVLRCLDETELLALVQRCHRVLRDGGRLLLTDQLLPYDRMAPLTGRTFLRWIGVRYTSDEVFGLLERSGFWECLVLRRNQFAADVVVRGEKVVQHARLDRSPTLSTNPSFRLIK